MILPMVIATIDYFLTNIGSNSQTKVFTVIGGIFIYFYFSILLLPLPLSRRLW